MTSPPSTRHHVHIVPPVRLGYVGMSHRPPMPPSMHNTTGSTRYRVSCATSQQRIRNKSPSFPLVIVAREERCSRLKFQPHPGRRALLGLKLAPAMGHTTKIRRWCLTGKGRREAPIHAVGSLSRAHNTLERSVYVFLLSLVRGTGFILFASGLLLLPRCTPHTPSWLTRQRSFLSPVYSSDMYVCQFVTRGSMLKNKGTGFLYCPCSEPGWICIYMGKRPVLVRISHYWCSLSLAQLYRRYKNRLQLGPEARCIGIDMNR